MSETVDQLVEAILDIARDESYTDATLIIADRIRKHVTPYVTALVDAEQWFADRNITGGSAPSIHANIRAALANAKA